MKNNLDEPRKRASFACEFTLRGLFVFLLVAALAFSVWQSFAGRPRINVMPSGKRPLVAETDLFQGKEVVCKVAQKDLANAGLWLDWDQEPPISARQAFRIARNSLPFCPLVDTESVDSLAIHSLSLKNIDRGIWYWLVEFEEPSITDFGDAYSNLPLVILMNGEVVMPVEMPPF